MKLKDQVCTLEQAKKLKELGVDQRSLWYWEVLKLTGVEGVAKERITVRFNIGHPISSGVVEQQYSAFTVAELGIMLPNVSGDYVTSSYYNDHMGLWYCEYRKLSVKDNDHEPYDETWVLEKEEEGETEAEARATLLIVLLEQQKINAPSVNQLLTA
jgi:hypothetical protein